jgi:hypothetical protein
MTGAVLQMSNFDVEFDKLNLTDCANITLGCFVGGTKDPDTGTIVPGSQNVWAVYFDVTGELTLRNFDEAPPDNAASRRRLLMQGPTGGRRLLETPTKATTIDFANVAEGTTFENFNVDGDGSARTLQVKACDQNGACTEGQLVNLPTVPVNDPPIAKVTAFNLAGLCMLTLSNPRGKRLDVGFGS